MYNQTEAQIKAEKTLNKQKFYFSNWISAQDDDPDHGTMIMKRKPNRFTTELRSIEPDGSIN